jgi:hypothetical protein
MHFPMHVSPKNLLRVVRRSRAAEQSQSRNLNPAYTISASLALIIIQGIAIGYTYLL